MTNAKESAFPSAFQNGLTKLEYFAVMAMQGNISTMSDNPFTDLGIETIAKESVKLAKALIAELNKTEE
jgi:hypothetical protein